MLLVLYYATRDDNSTLPAKLCSLANEAHAHALLPVGSGQAEVRGQSADVGLAQPCQREDRLNLSASFDTAWRERQGGSHDRAQLPGFARGSTSGLSSRRARDAGWTPRLSVLHVHSGLSISFGRLVFLFILDVSQNIVENKVSRRLLCQHKCLNEFLGLSVRRFVGHLTDDLNHDVGIGGLSVDVGNAKSGFRTMAKYSIGCETDAEVVDGVKRCVLGDEDGHYIPGGGI